MPKKRKNPSPPRDNSAQSDIKPKKIKADAGQSSSKSNAGEGSGEPYAAGGLKSTLHGNIYQLKLLMLFLWRGFKKGYNFALTTEMNAAEKFDYVVFRYEDKVKGDKVYRLQAKHKQDENKMIKNRDLETQNHENFSLQKYFISYCKFKQNAKCRSCILKDFVICSNIDIPEELKSSFETIEDDDDILTVKSMSKEYRLLKFKKLFPRRDAIFSILRETSKCFRLAKKLAFCIIHKKQLDLSDDLFKSYHHVLCEKILKKKKKDGKNICVFRTSFIDGRRLTPDIKKFRTNFYNTYLNLLQQEMSEREFFENIDKVELNSSSTFGNKLKDSIISLPDDDITDEEINDFLNVLVLTVIQPNELELSDRIKEEMGDWKTIDLIDTEFMFNQIQSEMLNWIKCKQGRFLNKADGDNFFQEITQKISKLVVMSQTIEYCNQVETLGIKFCEKIKELDLFLDSKEKKIFNLITNQTTTTLSAIKVYQTLNERKAYEKKDSYIFMQLNTLLSEKIQEYVIAASESTTNHLLVVECEITKENIQESKTQLLHIINLNEKKEKKVILITQKNDHVGKEIEQIYCRKSEIYEEKIDKESFFIDLAESSKEKLLERGMVIFQGSRMNLNTLMGNPSEALLERINGELLTKFIKKEDVYFGEIGEDINYDQIKDCYIKQILYQRTKDKRKKNKFWGCYDIEPRIGAFNTQESDDNGEDVIERYEPHNILDITEKVVIVAAEPGMGKSIILSHLAINTRLILPPVWIVRCNSQDYLRYKDRRGKGKRVSVMEAVRFLYKISSLQLFKQIDKYSNKYEKDNILEKLLIMESNGQMHFNLFDKSQNGKVLLNNKNEETCPGSSALLTEGSSLMEIELFTHYYNEGKIVLLFDGFDAINSKFQDEAMQLLQALQQTNIKKMWITTHTYNNVQNDLQEKLGVFSYSIQPFNEKEQKMFLIRFFEKSLEDGELNQDSINVAVDKILNTFSLYASDWKRKFIGVPLQLYMIANIFNETFKTINNSNDCDITEKMDEVLSEKFDLIPLYEEFIKEKLKIAIERNSLGVGTNYREMWKHIDLIYSKGDTDDDDNSDDQDDQEEIEELLRKIHEILAAYLLLSESSSENQIKHIKILMKMIQNGKEKTGIIHKITDDRPEFVHLSFAEYLAANYLWEKFKSIPINEFETFIQSHIIEKVIENIEPQLFRFFQLIVIETFKDQTDVLDELMKKLTILLTKLLDTMKKYCFCTRVVCGKPILKLVCYWKQGGVDTIRFKSAEMFLKIFEYSSLLEHNDRKVLHNIGNYAEQYAFLCLCVHRGYIKIGNVIANEIKIETLQYGIEHDDWGWSPLCLAAKHDYLKKMGILVTKYSSWAKSWKDTGGKYLIHEVMENLKDYWQLLELMDCNKPYSVHNEEKLPILELVHQSLNLNIPLKEMKSFTKCTNFDIVNKYMNLIDARQLPECLRDFKTEYHKETVEFMVKKGIDFSKALYFLLIEHLDKSKSHLDYSSYEMYCVEDFSSISRKIEMLLKCGIGYSYKDKRYQVTAFQVLKHMRNLCLILNAVLWKYNNDGSSNPLDTILCLILEYIAKLSNFRGYSIIITREQISLLPNYNNESHSTTEFLSPEYTQNIPFLPQYITKLFLNTNSSTEIKIYCKKLQNFVKNLIQDSDHTDLPDLGEKQNVDMPPKDCAIHDIFTEIEKRITKTEELIDATNSALAENETNMAKVKKVIIRLQNLEDVWKMRKVEEILQILDIKSEQTEELYQFTSEGINILLDIWPDLLNAGPRKITDTIEQMVKWFESSSNLYDIFEKLDNTYKALINAIKTENYQQLDEVLRENPNFTKAVINGQDDEFGSPLHYAAYKGDLQTTERLLIDGANPILRLNEHAKFLLPFTNSGEFMMENEDKVWNYENWSSLHLAALNDNDQVIQKLIEYGAEVNAAIYVETTHEGETALHACALSCCNSTKSAQVLLENGAQYDVKNIRGKTPLHLAKPNTEIEKLLYQIDQLFNAVKNDDTNTVCFLLEMINSNEITAISKASNADKNTLIQIAEDNKQTDILKLLENKLKPDELNDDQ